MTKRGKTAICNGWKWINPLSRSPRNCSTIVTPKKALFVVISLFRNLVIAYRTNIVVIVPNSRTVWNGVRPALRFLDITCLCILSFRLKNFSQTEQNQLMSTPQEQIVDRERGRMLRFYIGFQVIKFYCLPPPPPPPPPPKHLYYFPSTTTTFLLFSSSTTTTANTFLLFPSTTTTATTFLFSILRPRVSFFFLYEILSWGSSRLKDRRSRSSEMTDCAM